MKILSLFMLLIVFAGAGLPEGSDEDRAFLEEAVEAGYKGSYRQAVRDIEDYLADFPESSDGWTALARIETIRGHYEEAADAAEKSLGLKPGDADTRAILAEILILTGNYEKAEGLLRDAVDKEQDLLREQSMLARLLFETGRRDEALSLAKETTRSHADKQLDGDGLCDLARLYELLGDKDQAARAAVYADHQFNGLKGKNYRFERYEAQLLLGELYREARLGMGGGDQGSGNRALDCFRDALKINPNLPEALLGIAQTRYYAFNLAEAHNQLDKALRVNRYHAGSLALKAHMLILTRRYDAAAGFIETGFSANPNDKTLWAEQAALYLFAGKIDEYQAAIENALNTDPTYGEAYYRIAELLIYHYRFPEAEAHLKKCLELDPDFHEAYILLGRTLANLGREKEARQALNRSAELDPFNYPWRNNMLRVLSELEEYLTVETEPFKLVLDLDEADVMRHYLAEWGQESLDDFEEKFGIQAAAPLWLEMFPNNDDFAVRTVGFTGFGAVGACFGQVVTLLSPRAEPFRGGFCWASTLHHELCHVFTMQLSKYRIPRWLTEGISVYVEGDRKPAWRRNMDMTLFNRYHNDRLMRLDRFDQDFMSSDILFAYFQSGLVVQFIIDRYGFEALGDLVAAYGDDKGTTAVFQEVLGLDADRFETGFRSWLFKEKLGDIRCVPFYDEEKRQELVAAAQRNPDDVEALLKAAWACLRNDKKVDALYYLNQALIRSPDQPSIHLLQGEIAFKNGDGEKAKQFYDKAIEAGVRDLVAFMNLGLLALQEDDIEEAIRYFEEAKACFPTFIDPESPRHLLIQLYMRQEKKDQAVEEMAEMVAEGFQDIQTILSLAEHFEGEEEWERARAYYENAVQIDPFQRETHLKFARALKSCGEFGQALDELDMAAAVELELEPIVRQGGLAFRPSRDENSSLAAIYAERAAVLLTMGDEAEALNAVEKALSLKADHDQALSLKKKLTE